MLWSTLPPNEATKIELFGCEMVGRGQKEPCFFFPKQKFEKHPKARPRVQDSKANKG